MPVFKQLLREFIYPLAISLIWTLYNIWELPRSEWSMRTGVNVFGPTFFFVSWIIAQWFRVKKQQKVDGGLAAIEKSVKKTLADLDTKTADLVGQITGGDSVCYMIGFPSSNGTLLNLMLVHVGNYPLYEVSARIVDLVAFEKIKDDNNLTLDKIQQTEVHKKFGNLVPGFASLIGDAITVGDGPRHDFNIFYVARNGGFTQCLRFWKLDGEWHYATKVQRGDVTFHEQVSEGYPRNSAGDVDWS